MPSAFEDLPAEDERAPVGSNSTRDVAADRAASPVAVYRYKNPDSWVCALIPIMEKVWGDEIYKPEARKLAREFKDVWTMFKAQNHPDKKVQAGCSQSEIDLATRRMQEFNEWFDRKKEKVATGDFCLLSDVFKCATSCGPNLHDGRCYFRAKLAK